MTTQRQKPNALEPSHLSHSEPVPLVKASDLFNPMLTIADVMKRGAPTCSPDTSVAEAACILRDTASEAVFIVTDGRPLGLVTDRRIALAVAEHGENLGQLDVQELMEPRPPTVRADARLGALLETFADEGVAVVDAQGRIQGVVRWLDVLGHLSERALGKLIVKLFSPQTQI